ncbi:hypothetical protein D9757_010345 [Collybiopsis confluens]|uniref:Uncharacterized protein n=1 Tax=Collybiopsis confluens TaxID=2823264 RepID=A0A8H5GN36_9AGAR|nr:hypothetical protein D9757_010345 [Collybiopsis confluens]
MLKRKLASPKAAREPKNTKTWSNNATATAEVESHTIEELRNLVKHPSETSLDSVGTVRKDRHRIFLVNKDDSHFVWEAAQSNHESLPEKPENVDETAYASLLYDAHFSEDVAQLLSRLDFNFKPDPPLIMQDELPGLVDPAYYPLQFTSVAKDYLAEYHREVKDEATFSPWKTRLQAEKVKRKKYKEECAHCYERMLRGQLNQKRALIGERIKRRLGGRRATGLRFHPSVSVPQELTDKGDSFPPNSSTKETSVERSIVSLQSHAKSAGYIINWYPNNEVYFEDLERFLQGLQNTQDDSKLSGYEGDFLDDFGSLYVEEFSDPDIYHDRLGELICGNDDAQEFPPD